MPLDGRRPLVVHPPHVPPQEGREPILPQRREFPEGRHGPAARRAPHLHVDLVVAGELDAGRALLAEQLRLVATSRGVQVRAVVTGRSRLPLAGVKVFCLGVGLRLDGGGLGLPAKFLPGLA